MTRYFQYKLKCTTKNVGFIPDIIRILQKYSILEHFEIYLECGEFASKLKWKLLCKQAIWRKENECWQHRISSCSDFDRFNQIHTSISPSVLWKVASKYPKSLNECAYVAKLCTRIKTSSFCSICVQPYTDDLFHFAFECIDSTNVGCRNEFQNKLGLVLKDDTLDVLLSIPLDILLITMLGGNSDFLLTYLERSEYERFILTSAQFLCKLDLCPDVDLA